MSLLRIQGEYISALSNGAALKSRPFGYLIFGIDDVTHEVKNTTYDFQKEKVGNENLENWLRRLLSPDIPFTVHTVEYAAKHRVVLFEIPAAYIHPTSFAGRDYIRIGSCRQDLHRYPSEAKKLWEALNHTSYEQAVSVNQNLHFTEVMMVARKRGVDFSEDRFNTLRMLDSNGRFNNLALLLSDENPHVVKFAVYKDDSLNFSVKEEFTGSWLLMLDQAFKYVNLYNTTSATIGSELARTEVQSYPDPSLREMVVNAFGHMDFSFPSDIKIEFYKDRVEVSSPGSIYRTTIEEVLKGKQSFRNPNLIFVLSKFKYIENYATGIRRTNAAYEKSGLKPLYDVTENFFTAILPNVNYSRMSSGKSIYDVTPQVTPQVNHDGDDAVIFEKILDYCITPKSGKDILEYLGYKDRKNFNQRYLKPMLAEGKLTVTKEQKHSKRQKYVSVKAGL